MNRVDLSIRRYGRDVAIPDFEKNLRDWIVEQGYREVSSCLGADYTSGDRYYEMTFTLENEKPRVNKGG